MDKKSKFKVGAIIALLFMCVNAFAQCDEIITFVDSAGCEKVLTSKALFSELVMSEIKLDSTNAQLKDIQTDSDSLETRYNKVAEDNKELRESFVEQNKKHLEREAISDANAATAKQALSDINKQYEQEQIRSNKFKTQRVYWGIGGITLTLAVEVLVFILVK